MRNLVIAFYLKTLRAFSGSGLYRNALVRRVNKRLLRILKRQTVAVNGFVLHLDKADSLNLSLYNSFEVFETTFFKKMIKPGAAVLDIGANIGYYTTLFSRLAGSDGRIIAFEPDRDLFPILSKNIQRNGLTNVQVENQAIADATGKIKLYYSADKGDQRIYDSGDDRPFYEVRAVSIDNYFSKPIKIDWVKVDIQGAEGFALQGMRNTILANKEIKIVCEFWPYGIEQSGYGSQRFFHLLDEFGFRIYELNERKGSIRLTNAEGLLAEYTPVSRKFTNLILSTTDLDEG